MRGLLAFDRSVEQQLTIGRAKARREPCRRASRLSTLHWELHRGQSIRLPQATGPNHQKTQDGDCGVAGGISLAGATSTANGMRLFAEHCRHILHLLNSENLNIC